LVSHQAPRISSLSLLYTALSLSTLRHGYFTSSCLLLSSTHSATSPLRCSSTTSIMSDYHRGFGKITHQVRHSPYPTSRSRLRSTTCQQISLLSLALRLTDSEQITALGLTTITSLALRDTTFTSTTLTLVTSHVNIHHIIIEESSHTPATSSESLAPTHLDCGHSTSQEKVHGIVVWCGHGCWSRAFARPVVRWTMFAHGLSMAVCREVSNRYPWSFLRD
jgi:hypothetical protein